MCVWLVCFPVFRSRISLDSTAMRPTLSCDRTSGQCLKRTMSPMWPCPRHLTTLSPVYLPCSITCSLNLITRPNLENVPLVLAGCVGLLCLYLCSPYSFTPDAYLIWTDWGSKLVWIHSFCVALTYDPIAAPPNSLSQVVCWAWPAVPVWSTCGDLWSVSTHLFLWIQTIKCVGLSWLFWHS